MQSIPVYQRGPVTVIPIRCVAAGASRGAFLVLDANIELIQDDSQTTLAIVGSYRPPLGRIGEAI